MPDMTFTHTAPDLTADELDGQDTPTYQDADDNRLAEAAWPHAHTLAHTLAGVSPDSVVTVTVAGHTGETEGADGDRYAVRTVTVTVQAIVPADKPTPVPADDKPTPDEAPAVTVPEVTVPSADTEDHSL